MIQVIGNGTDTYITGPIAVAAAGAFIAVFCEFQDASPGEDVVECTHGAKKTDKAFFNKGSSEKDTGEK